MPCRARRGQAAAAALRRQLLLRARRRRGAVAAAAAARLAVLGREERVNQGSAPQQLAHALKRCLCGEQLLEEGVAEVTLSWVLQRNRDKSKSRHVSSHGCRC